MTLASKVNRKSALLSCIAVLIIALAVWQAVSQGIRAGRLERENREAIASLDFIKRELHIADDRLKQWETERSSAIEAAVQREDMLTRRIEELKDSVAKAIEQQKAAEERSRKARKAESTAAALTKVLQDALSDTYTAVDRSQRKARPFSMADQLRRRAPKVTDRSDPEVTAMMYRIMAGIATITRHDALAADFARTAHDQLVKSRDINDPEIIAVDLLLGRAQVFLGQFDEAEATFRDALARSRQVHGDADIKTRRVIEQLIECLRLNGCPAEAVPMYDELLSRDMNENPRHEMMLERAWAMLDAGWNERAEQAFRELRTVFAKARPENPIALGSLAGLAWSLRKQGRVNDAMLIHDDLVSLSKFMDAIQRPVRSDLLGCYLVAYGNYDRAFVSLTKVFQSLQTKDERGYAMNRVLAALSRVAEEMGNDRMQREYTSQMVRAAKKS